MIEQILSVSDFMLNSGTVHPVSEEDADAGIEVTTSRTRWDYAVVYRLPPDLAARLGEAERLRVEVQGEVQEGRVGIGLVEEDFSTFLAEECHEGDEGPDAGPLTVDLPRERLDQARFLVFRNAGVGRAVFRIKRIALVQAEAGELDENGSSGAKLHEVTLQPFSPRAERVPGFRMGSVAVTEVCNLTCVMCHFNGPHATRRSRSLRPTAVQSVLQQMPSGETIWFAATGEFFMDPHALDHVRSAGDLGLKPAVLTNGLLLTPAVADALLAAGVRLIRMSVDSHDPDEYRKIRRGGELSDVLAHCDYLRQLKDKYQDLRVEINVTLLGRNMGKMDAMIDFWRPRVDQVNFNTEYYDVFRFRQAFFVPKKRTNCEIQLYVMPSGRVAPCCAMAVYQHEHDVSWLPHIDSGRSMEEIYQSLCDLYDDPDSPLSKLCATCDWWMLFHYKDGQTPYLKMVPFDKPA
ncbi:radical SAM protein [Azospirillum palustre]|nr:radical SAM protein [Azospirillum palustre]